MLAVADASVSPARVSGTPAAGMGGDPTVLAAGGPEGSLAFLTFQVAGIEAGTVLDARLVLTGAGQLSGAGGTLGALPGVWIDEAGMTYETAPAYDAPPALAGDETVAYIDWIGPGTETTIDVTGTVREDGTVTFVLAGTPESPIAVASRESAAPPRLVIAIRDT